MCCPHIVEESKLARGETAIDSHLSHALSQLLYNLDDTCFDKYQFCPHLHYYCIACIPHHPARNKKQRNHAYNRNSPF